MQGGGGLILSVTCRRKSRKLSEVHIARDHNVHARNGIRQHIVLTILENIRAVLLSYSRGSAVTLRSDLIEDLSNLLANRRALAAEVFH